MTFEEFFKKKKIDLDQLQAAEPVLFAEFQSHYGQMGEKSFDHTKKYWFNNLRRLYHTPEEVKVEKVRIENQLAEQTIIESITEKVETPPAPKTGFTPRFKAGATKAAEEVKPGTIKEAVNPAAEETPAPKVGFTPRFKAGVPKPAEENIPETEPEGISAGTGEAPKPAPAVVGVVTNNPPAEIKMEDNPAIAAEEAPAPKVGFTPRFKAGVTKPAEENTPAVPAVVDAPAVVGVVTNNPPAEIKMEDNPATAAEEAPKSKAGFTPRFKAGVTKPKKEGE